MNKVDKLFWWLRNRNRIYLALQRECDMGGFNCMIFHSADKNKTNGIMLEIRRHRRNVDRLKQLHQGKSPWDTAKMPGWERRDASFRLMEIGRIVTDE